VRTRIVCLNALIASLAIAASVASSDDQAPKPVAQIGNPDSTKWTATTYEAAASEANKKVLASGKPVTVTGEVVDVSCYLQLGKRGEAHIPCGSKCLEHGQPIGLLDKDEKLYILFAEEHHPRRDGLVDLKKVFVPLLAKTVSVTGMETDMKDYHALFVRASDLDGVKAEKSGTMK